MDDSQQRKLNRAQAESAFMRDYQADFPKDSPGDKTAKALNVQIAQVLTLAGEQVSQERRANIGIKSDLFDNLDAWMQKINRAAIALDDEIPGIRDLFRMPRNRSEENRLAGARNFYTASAQYQDQFEEYDLPEDFRAEGMNLISQIEATQATADTSEERTGGATGGLTAAFREIGKLTNKLNAIVKNKYYNNPQKLAAWAIASHLEAAPKSKKAEPSE